MPRNLVMPKIGVNMTEAIIVKWLVGPGDLLKKGDVMLEAETDKALQEIAATEDGYLAKILVAEGEKALCQDPIAVLVDTEAEIVDAQSEAAQPEQQEEQSLSEAAVPVKEAVKTAVPAKSLSGRIKISPLAKKIAKDNGIDISNLSPATAGARIVKHDVLSYIEKNKAYSATPQAVVESIPYEGVRKLIGDRMTESVQTKPSVAMTLHADVEAMIAWRNSLKAKGESISFNSMLVLIAAKALEEHPAINSKLEGNEIKLLGDINIGVAVDSDKGLIVPVVRNAGRKGLLDIQADFADKVSAIRSGAFSLDDISGGTFTITNLGMFEIEQFSAIINPPECCILAVGAIVKEPVVGEDDNIVIKSRMQLTLTFDHRIVDGATAAKFLRRIKHLVQDPLELLC